MSVYQYYEFHAIDRPLTPDEQEDVAQLSSRVDPHPRRAVFVYHWSDFPGQAEEVLARYYDAMIYMANWGSRRLLFRFPRALIDAALIQAYIPAFDFEGRMSLSTVGEYAVLKFVLRREGEGGWLEGEGWLDRLAPLRNDLLRGDYRALYLIWLKVLELEDVLDSVREPPVPVGLGQLTPALESLIAFFEVDESLVHAAAEASGSPDAVSDAWMRQAIAQLSRHECNAFLLQLAQGEPNASLMLNRRLRDLAGVQAPAMQASARTVGELQSLARQWREAERRRLAQEAERKRIAELEALARREPQVWSEIDALIPRTTGSAYREAVALLVRLRALAIHQGRKPAFDQRLDAIYAQHSRRKALVRRLRDAGLHPSQTQLDAAVEE